MRSTSWLDNVHNESSQSFPISYWEMSDTKTVEQNLSPQCLLDWKYFSTMMRDGQETAGKSRTRGQDSLSSNESQPTSGDSDHYSSISSSSSSRLLNSSSSSSPSKRTSSISRDGERYKTELCRPYEEYGSCKYGDKCQFAHGKDQLRNVMRHPKYKTDKCRTFYSTGFCPYGQRCHFIHDQQPTVASDSKKINNNTTGMLEQQLLVVKQQQQLRSMAVLQQLQASILLNQQQSQLTLFQGFQASSNLCVNSLTGSPAPSSTNDQLIESMKRMLSLSSGNETFSTASTSQKPVSASVSSDSLRLRPTSLQILNYGHNTVNTRSSSPIGMHWGGSVGSTTASSPTKSIPSSCFSPSPSPTSLVEVNDLYESAGDAKSMVFNNKLNGDSIHRSTINTGYFPLNATNMWSAGMLNASMPMNLIL